MLNRKRGEMGIGTLIIFIALLLVAAIAAGVLIQTSGSLQEKALTTGDEARAQISTNAVVIEVAATDGQDKNLENFTSIMKLAPGSDAIKLGEALLTFNTFNSSVTLTYGGIENSTNTFSTDATAENGTFTIEYLQQGSNFVQDNLQRGDVVKLYYAAPRPIGESEDISMTFIPKIGTPTSTQFITPEVISTYQVYLYP